MTEADLPPSVRAFVAETPVVRGPIATAVAEAARTLPAGSRVLDAGAGLAPYRPLFGHCRYMTQDWPGTVHREQDPPDIVADLHDLPVPDESFDFVLCTEVLEHVQDPRRVLAQLRRVLSPGGRLLMTTPFVMELHEEPFDFFRYTPYALRTLLEDAGLTVEQIAPTSGWWSTLAHVLRHAGLATRPPDPPASEATRLFELVTLAVSVLLAKLAPGLDRLDRRRALPIGYVSVAWRPHTPAEETAERPASGDPP